MRVAVSTRTGGTYVVDYGRPEVRNVLVANELHWCAEFHVDGLRWAQQVQRGGPHWSYTSMKSSVDATLPPITERLFRRSTVDCRCMVPDCNSTVADSRPR